MGRIKVQVQTGDGGIRTLLVVSVSIRPASLSSSETDGQKPFWGLPDRGLAGKAGASHTSPWRALGALLVRAL